MRKRLHTVIFAFLGVFLLFSTGFAASPEPQSPQAKQIKALVDKAAALIESKGKDAFPEFRKKGGEWHKGDTYIFVNDMKGTTLVNAAFPELEGKNNLELKDANGKAITREFIELLKTKDSGWVDYLWPKPEQTKPSKKSSYVKRVKLGKEMIYVGAGIYTE